MATIKAGNGTDPWKMLGDYVKGQNNQILQRQRDNATMDRLEFQQSQQNARQAATQDPSAVYDRAAARYRARSEYTAGKPGKDMTSSAAAQAFKAGLIEGGINNPHALATILGNAQHESSFNPNALGDTDLGPGREAHGIIQWREGRFKALQDYAAAKGGNWTDPKIQGGYAAHELTKNPQYAPIGQALNNLKSLDGAQPLMRQYLGYKVAVANEPERMGNADMWFKKSTGTKPAPIVADNGLYRDPNDPTHVYRTEPGEKGVKFQLTQMKPGSAQEAQQEFVRSPGPDGKRRGKDGMRMVELVPDGPMKDGKMTYRVYTDPPPLAPAAPPAVASAPVAAVPVAPPTPEVTGTVVPTVAAEESVQPLQPPVEQVLDEADAAEERGFADEE